MYVCLSQNSFYKSFLANFVHVNNIDMQVETYDNEPSGRERPMTVDIISRSISVGQGRPLDPQTDKYLHMDTLTTVLRGP